MTSIHDFLSFDFHCKLSVVAGKVLHKIVPCGTDWVFARHYLSISSFMAGWISAFYCLSPLPKEKRSLWPNNGRWNFSHSRSEEHTSELQSRPHLVCRLLLE